MKNFNKKHCGLNFNYENRLIFKNLEAKNNYQIEEKNLILTNKDNPINDGKKQILSAISDILKPVDNKFIQQEIRTFINNLGDDKILPLSKEERINMLEKGYYSRELYDFYNLMFKLAGVENNDNLTSEENKKFKDLIELFLKEIINITKEKTHAGKKDELKKLNVILSKSFFSFTPNIVDHLNLNNFLNVCALANRVSEEHFHYFERMYGELIYYLKYLSEESLHDIIVLNKNKTNSEILNLVYFLKKLSFVGISQGFYITPVVISILEGIKSNSNNRLVDYAIDITKKSLNRGSEAELIASRDLYRPNNFMHNGQIENIPDRIFGIFAISQDYLGAYNINMKPQMIARKTPDLKNLDWHYYDEIKEDNQLIPFEIETEENTGLLLQMLDLHELRSFIEQDLKIDFEQMTEQSKIHFLRFLMDKQNDHIFSQLKLILQNNHHIKNEILASFLACADDLEMGDLILELAQNENTIELFKAYYNFAITVEQKTIELYRIYKKVIPDGAVSNENIRQNLLRRGSDLLKIAKIKDNHTDYQSEIKQLKQEETLMANILREIEIIQTNNLMHKDNEKLAEKLKNKVEDTILGEIDLQIDSQLLQKYQELVNSSKKVSQTIQQFFPNNTINESEVEEDLLLDAVELISTPTDQNEIKIALEKLKSKNKNIELFSQIIKNLPKEEVANLDLKNLPIIEKIEDIHAGLLLERPDLLNQIIPIIKEQFPSGDDEEFMKYLQTADANFTITLANNKIIAFFAKENFPGEIKYLDWFIANPDAQIKGLAEATLKLGFDEQVELESPYYAVAKPHVKSFLILIEKLDCVAFGQKQYKHNYLQCRRIPFEIDNYAGKKLNEIQINAVKNICKSVDTVYEYATTVNEKVANLKLCKGLRRK